MRACGSSFRCKMSASFAHSEILAIAAVAEALVMWHSCL